MDFQEKKRQLKELYAEAEKVHSLISAIAIHLTNIQDEISEELMEDRMSEFDLDGRTLNCFSRVNIFTVRDLMKWKKSDLMKIRGFGSFCMKSVESFLKEHRLEMKE